MKVLLVSGPAAGGIRAHLWQLLSSLPAQDVEPLLAAPPSLLAPPGTARADLRLGERLQPLADLGPVRQLAALVEKERPQLVHAQGYKAGLVAAVAGGPPLILTLHNLWPQRAGLLARAGLRWMARASSRQIAVSQAVLDSVAAVTGPLSHPIVIPNAVDVAHFSTIPSRAAARAALGLGEREPVVGFAGRLTPVKGAQVLVGAAGRLRADTPDLRLILAGDGPQRRELERTAAALDLGRQIVMPGAVPDVRPLFAAADVWAIPSLAEGGGIVALEAMAAGIPIVASAVGGLLETLEDGQTALLVPPGGEEALAKALERLLRDAALAGELSRNAAAAVRDWPDGAEMARRVAAAYRDALGATSA